MSNKESRAQLVAFPIETLDKLLQSQDLIIEKLNKLQLSDRDKADYITAQAFMDACSLSRSTFDELRNRNEIHVIKKNRKLYLKADAVRKYMEGK